MILWRFFNRDSTPVEICTAAFTATIAMSCWLGEWFTYRFVRLTDYAGYEFIPAAMMLVVSAIHVLAVVGGDRKLRQGFALTAAAIVGGIGAYVMAEAGWVYAGGPAAVLGAFIQGWVYLSLESDASDERCSRAF